MEQKNIEVEVRSFISKEQYNQLLKFFGKEGNLIDKSEQETHYFDCEQDLRIQKSTNHSKVWLKKGKLHDDHREEIELKAKAEDFTTFQQLFDALNYNVEIKWFRARHTFDWNDCKVMIDHTKGYGYIIEIEKMATEQTKKEVFEQLQKKLNELNVPQTPKEEFKKQFEYYKQHWKELVNK